MKLPNGTTIRSEYDFRELKYKNTPNLMETRMTAQKSEVFEEFLKIAAKQDMLGLNKIAMPEKSRYQEDEKTIKEKRVKSEEDIIEKAHPDPVFVAESEGEGGLVENQNEQHKKMMEVINKMPTGSLVSRYAGAISELVKLANACDAAGEIRAADIITRAAEELFLKLDTCCPLK